MSYPRPNNPCSYPNCYNKNQMRNDFYSELGVIVFWSFITFYLLILVCIYFSNMKSNRRKYDKKQNKKEIRVYCEYLQTKECKYPKIQCGNCKIYNKFSKIEYIKKRTNQLLKIQEKLNNRRKIKRIIKSNLKNEKYEI